MVKEAAESDVIRRLNIHGVLAMAGMAGPVVLAAADLSASLSSPTYSYLDDSISSLALTSLGWVQTIGFLAIGLLVEIFVAGLLYNIRPSRGFHFGILLLVLFGFGLLLLGAFRTDPTGTVHHTTEGTIHSFMATANFWLFPAAIALIAPSLRSDPEWHNIFVYTLVACGLDIALVITMGTLRHRIGWFGLLERLVVGNMIVWVEVTAIKMLRLSIRRCKLPLP
jgi:hypothetical protein